MLLPVALPAGTGRERVEARIVEPDWRRVCMLVPLPLCLDGLVRPGLAGGGDRPNVLELLGPVAVDCDVPVRFRLVMLGWTLIGLLALLKGAALVGGDESGV